MMMMMARRKVYLLMWLVAAAVILSRGDPVGVKAEEFNGNLSESFNFTYNYDLYYYYPEDPGAYVSSSSSAVNYNPFHVIYVLFILCML
ncbi:Hypothetical predicted protein [Scomber scombrus]|uniref:Uncharacterized protein n=1 Tax=Scomber scombrus TaxID=13677 RepID=A0AAV1QDG8_SCOSC